MKKYLKFMTFAMVAVCSLISVSCGDDDDDDFGSQSSKKDYTFLLNGKTYYYGTYSTLWGLQINADYDLHLDFYEQNLDYYSFNVTGVDNKTPSVTFDKDGNLVLNDTTAYYSAELFLYFKKFDVNSIKKGDELEFNGNTFNTIYFNYHYYTSTPPYFQDIAKYYRRENSSTGKVRFVSYGKFDYGYKAITLEFDNVTFELDKRFDYSSHPYKAESITINGEIVFLSRI